MQPFKLFRPSDGPYKELCSRFERTFTTSPNAQRGTEFHQVIAAIIRQDQPVVIPNHLQSAVGYAVDLWPQLFNPDFPPDIEREIALLSQEGDFITSGTIDCCGQKESRTAIVDWKTGQERDYWMQISIYGVALIDSLFPSPRENIEIDLTLAFVDQQKHFTQTCTYGELRERVDNLINEMLDPASPYSINAYCGYCDIRGRCPAWDRERALLAQSNGDLSERFDIIRRDPVALGRFIVALRRLNKLSENEQLDKLAIQYLKSGQDVPGVNVVRSEGKPVYDKEALAQAIKLWEEDHGGNRFPVTRTPYEYLKMK